MQFLISSESAFTPQGCSDCFGVPYGVATPLPTTSYSDPCLPTIGSWITDPNVGTGGGTTTTTDIDHNIAIANGDITYINYPEVGLWLDEKALYEKLDRDITLRNSDVTLLNFYNLKHQQIIGRVRDADRALANLVRNINANNIGDLLDIANDKNADIINGDIWE